MTNWTHIVQQHGPLVFGTAWRILGHVADTEDVFQEVFLQAHQMHGARGVRHWPALLRRLATCRALDRLRQRRITLPLEEVQQSSPDPGPEDRVISEELRQRLRQALGELPPREAEVFSLRYFEELSYQEIAEALHITSGAVAAALHKARGRLEALLSECVKGD